MTAQLFLYNSRTRKKQPFEPRDAACVQIYVCGPTVYGPAHIGNARPAVVFDVLVRLLRACYRQVVYARNITDIDDKITARAAEEGVDIAVIADRYRAQYHEDMDALGVLPPDIEPHATQHIAPILEMIARLIERGHAYLAEGHVLFDVSKDADYGGLSGRDMADMIAGARVEVAPYKNNPADFVLWKPSSADQPGWDSPYGRGRPGWHIECSAMIATHLGETIDIHGGGHDLQFPHHENESAQSRCAHGKRLANFWLHNGMLTLSDEKMSKSLGNIRLVSELLADTPGEAIRLALLQGHYRQKLDFTPDLLQQSVTMLDRLYGALRDAPAGDGAPSDGFMAALYDDLNTPRALAELFTMARSDAASKASLQAAGALLGILQKQPEAWRQRGDDKARIEELVAVRDGARAAKDFAAADAARDELAAMGVVLEDTAKGTIWRRG